MSAQPVPTRRSRDELRELVMSAALELIRSEGLGAVSTTLTYQKVFDHLEKTHGIRVTRASVHERIWSSQDDFRLDALIEARPWTTTAEITVEPALEVFVQTEGMAALDRMKEMTRVAAELTQLAADQDPLYYSWVGMTMTMAKDPSIRPDHREVLEAAVSDAYAQITSSVMSVLRVLGEALGLRPRLDLFDSADDGWTVIVKLGTALSEGVTVRTRLSETELPPLMLATGPNGEFQKWSAFAAGYWALLQTFLEIDPEAHPDSDETS
jgi:hypothetical protein